MSVPNPNARESSLLAARPVARDDEAGCSVGGGRGVCGEPHSERTGQPERVRLGELGAWPREELVDRAVPEVQPGLEVALAQLDLAMQRGVRVERAAVVGLRAEQQRLPEGGDVRHVRLEV